MSCFDKRHTFLTANVIIILVLRTVSSLYSYLILIFNTLPLLFGDVESCFIRWDDAWVFGCFCYLCAA